ncbi:MAG TPA: peptidoglycan-binding protein [Blastocatellia bacterium]|nr:peptidoglycan-binding protein [Blastocatellia bacterium]
MNNHLRKSASVILALALMLVVTLPALAGRPVTVPAGTVIPLTMDTYLGSDSSKVGDKFTATVTRDVIIDGQLAIPANAKIEGHVTGTTPSERSSRAGTIAVAFDRLVMSDGGSVPIDGTLTTLSEEGRRQIDQSIDEESRVSGGSRTRRGVVFIGGGAGAGAVIGAIAGGGKGAAVGAGIGAVLGTLGVLLSKGEKAEVQPGTEFGVMIERSFTVESSGVAGDRFDQSNSGSFNPVREAQMMLRDKGFYRGPINGEMSSELRSSIRNFQRDRNLPMTGELDPRTARELGLADQGPSSQGPSTLPVSGTSDAIRAAQIVLRDRGFYNGQINGQMTPATQNALRSFQRDRNLTVTGDLDVRTARELGVADQGTPVSGGSVQGGTTGIGNARQIAFLANRLLQDYMRELNIRGGRGQVTFDSRRTLTQNEVELLFQLDALQSAAQLYSQIAANVSDPDALKGAADSLIRQMRLTSRVMRRNSTMKLSNIVTNDWEQIRTEIRNISVTDNNLDSDIIR